MLLTGTNLRWEDRTRVWREGWRNLHGDGPTILSARFRVDGEKEPLELRRKWSADAALDGGDPVEVSGARASWEAVGWDAALAQFRPLLSYNELGTMFSERAAALYEALSAVLGLEEFDELSATLRAARLDREKSGKTEKLERKALIATIGAADGDRAAAIAPLLAKMRPDVDAIEAAAAGAFETDEDGRLQALAALQLPDGQAIESAFDGLSRALEDVARLEATDADRLEALARLLDEAVAFHRQHGQEATCPVCGTARGPRHGMAHPLAGGDRGAPPSQRGPARRTGRRAVGTPGCRCVVPNVARVDRRRRAPRGVGAVVDRDA